MDSYLSPTDWCHDPSLWKEVTIMGIKLTSIMLIGIVRRQPRFLDLSWCIVSDKQLAWLLPRLPQLQSLKLTGSSALTLSALRSCNCPLLSSIDLSWTESCDDHAKLLLSKPPDWRPGLMETKTRLRFLSEIKFAGK